MLILYVCFLQTESLMHENLSAFLFNLILKES